MPYLELSGGFMIEDTIFVDCPYCGRKRTPFRRMDNPPWICHDAPMVVIGMYYICEACSSWCIVSEHHKWVGEDVEPFMGPSSPSYVSSSDGTRDRRETSSDRDGSDKDVDKDFGAFMGINGRESRRRRSESIPTSHARSVSDESSETVRFRERQRAGIIKHVQSHLCDCTR